MTYRDVIAVGNAIIDDRSRLLESIRAEARSLKKGDEWVAENFRRLVGE